MGVDLVLSSGFLAFAAQAGFLAAVEDVGLEVDAVCGTSSGALAGALWSAGMPAEQLFDELCRRPPLTWVRPHVRVWRGLFRMDPVLRRLAADLPTRFDGLPHPFAAGVAAGGAAHLLTEGPLVEAVAASCAVPYLFTPVEVSGRWYVDGGAVDRTMLASWRARRPGRRVVMHLLEASHGAPGDAGDADVVVHSPRSGAKLWSLGDARGRFERTRSLARRVLAATHEPPTGASTDDEGSQRV